MKMTATSALLLEGVSKAFGATRALRDVTLDFRVGEVHGLLGQNGSGKSTLVKILAGYHIPDAGTCTSWGEPVGFPIRNAGRLGIAVIHQDLGLAEDMTVMENLGASVGYGARSSLAPVRWRRDRAIGAEVLGNLGVHVDLDRRVADLSPAERTFVAIARALRELSRRSDRHVFILDEPTAHLGGSEARRVVDLMRTIAQRGSCVIFISHHVAELVEATDRLTVLRDGAVVATTESATVHDLVAMMLGRSLDDFYPEPLDRGPGELLLRCEGLAGDSLRSFTLSLTAGEIVGLTGLTGMGHQEVPYLLAGVKAPAAGKIILPGGDQLARGPRQAKRAGVVLVPGSRATEGLWLGASSRENLSLPYLGRYFRWTRLQQSIERADAVGLMDRFKVRPPRPEAPLSSLSGGNQQKVLLAKWLQATPRVLVLDEPTQGIDVGAKHDILEMVRTSARDGAAVLLSSTDEEQLANVCTRVLVLNRGQVAMELHGSDLSAGRIVESCYVAA